MGTHKADERESPLFWTALVLWVIVLLSGIGAFAFQENTSMFWIAYVLTVVSLLCMMVVLLVCTFRRR